MMKDDLIKCDICGRSENFIDSWVDNGITLCRGCGRRRRDEILRNGWEYRQALEKKGRRLATADGPED